jgi:AAA domain
MARTFFSSSIQELEALFSEQNDSLELLHALQAELTHRKTERAARLRTQVTERLTALRSGISSREQTSQELPLFPQHHHQSASRSHEEPPSHHPQPLPAAAPAPSETPRAEGRTTPPPPLPPITNRPGEVLSAWTALEVLSPPAYVRPEDLAGGDRMRIATLSESALPWERGEKSRPNQRLYYQVILGSVKMEPAVERLIEQYGDTRPEKPGARGKAALAVVVVDRQGQLIESPAVSISSFGWGVMSALNGELANLAQWPEVEPQLVERIEKLLLGVVTGDEDEEELRHRPLARAALFAAYQALIHELRLPQEWLEPPKFAIRSYAYFKDPNPPEPILLNSFFLTDLALARQLFCESKVPQNLRRYLGVERPQRGGDLLRDTTALADAVSPGFTHLSRWPGKNRSSLVLLQQAAVNLAFRETKTGGLLGINGPPGTGKTTLLRDLVAGVVTARAEAMAKFDDPERAFEHSGQQLKAGNSWIHLYRLNASLRGFEMVVASSNNKAVENVSAELPGRGAIANDAPELRYFKTLPDVLHQSETWGAIAAVLGNAQNRSRFKQTFWWDDDNGLNSYLWAAVGSVREVEITDPETGYVVRRTPHIVEAEQPPSTREAALDRWRSARQRFLSALDKSRQWQTWLETLRTELARLPALAQAETSAAAQHDAAVETARRFEAVAATARQAEAETSRQLQHTDQALHIHGLAKPGFWARLFRTRAAHEWSDKLAVLRAHHRGAETQHSKTTAERCRIEEELRRARLKQQHAETAWQATCAQHQQAKQRLAEAQQQYGVVLADAAFFALEHGKRHQMTPWFPPAAQRLRDEVFIAAMAVHRAFIDAAAKPLRHNLGALMNAFTTQTLPGAEKQALLPDLWASLFLVVPLVSTTFASVNRMLGKLPLESLGWLFVDEAGQALPQAAVGALLRTRRAVIVGDPVQIEPVVVLPDTLTQAICRRFGVDPDHYAAPSASVQTLADAASTYASEFQTRVGSRSVGVPLLVHRRCAEPMFGVSNAIAYSGMMVSAKSPQPSDIRNVLGPSRWIHVEGSGEDKWCREEGGEVLRLLRQMAQADTKPDLYIIYAVCYRRRPPAPGSTRKWSAQRLG